MGQLANSRPCRHRGRELEKRRKAALNAAALEAKLEAEAVDVTIPGKRDGRWAISTP